ncbi:hypothetical protein K8F61_02760 [Microbacterium resistens]|uniref:Uncharacterized protein n=1 Tax=Microbacterium resistens TaxID=156977 RepID=A0ABY3RW75_9MICO|nr:hypothetical protein [Microbacterium resistens]UGS27151.1 hypothetical protein K8F61_02760 [Microbacterium resistens]
MKRRAHELRVPRGIPGIVPRLLVLLVTTAGVLALTPFIVWQVVAVAAASVSVVLPRSFAAWAGAACLPIGVLLTAPSPGRTALAVLLVHAIHVLAALSLTIPAGSRIAPGLLRPVLRRFVVIQAIAQPVAATAALLPQAGAADTAWLAPLGAALLLVVATATTQLMRRGSAARGADVGGPS